MIAIRKGARLICWKEDRAAELESELESAGFVIESGPFDQWICWPKKSSGVDTDVTQNLVRERGLAAGIVDFKICAVDGTWSGLCFTRRRRK